MRRLGLLLAALWAAPAAGQVVSAAPDGAAVTIYRLSTRTDLEDDTRLEDMETSQGLAMIRETRMVDLPAGRSRISFRGVADTMVPQTAAVEGVPGAILERNEDYNLLTPGALIDASIGRTVQLVRTNPKTGAATSRPAVIRAGSTGPVLDVDGRIEGLGCSGAPERLVFDALPPNLADKPTFSVLADVPKAGRYPVRLSYLATGLGWSADYVARIAPDGRTLDLTGWITLTNQTSLSFEHAPTDVVAGELSHDGDTAAPAFPTTGLTIRCWPLRQRGGRSEGLAFATPPMPAAFDRAGAGDLQEVVVTAQKIAVQSELGDYKLYTLPEPTTVASHQTKQVLFLQQRGARFDRVYVYRFAGEAHDEGHLDPATAVVRLRNEAKAGLGKPLPAGAVTVMAQSSGGRAALVGQWRIRDVPVGLPVDVELGRAMDVQVHVTEAASGDGPNDTKWRDYDVSLVNDKSVAVSLEYVQSRQTDAFRIAKASRRPDARNGGALWTVRLPPGGRETFHYRVYEEWF